MSNIQVQKYVYTKEYRYTNMGGLTKYIAVCMICRRVIPPINKRRSRRGTHGEDYYVHEHPLEFVLLYSSNHGNRRMVVPEELKKIANELELAWVYENASIDEIIKLINSYLKSI
jgi:hypothetical protein